MEKTSAAFLKNLHDIRKNQLGLTQSEAAERIGISLRYYQQLEKGDSWPSPDVFDGICRAFEREPWELLQPKAGRSRVGVANESGLTLADALRLWGAYETAPRHIRESVDALLSGSVDVEANLARLRQPQQESKLKKS